MVMLGFRLLLPTPPGHPAQRQVAPFAHMPFQHVICPSLTPLSSHGCQALFAIDEESDADVALSGGYYGTSEPKEHLTCPQVTSPIRLLRHLALKASTPQWAFTPHTF